MAEVSMPPWHLWGMSNKISLVGGPQAFIQTQQLNRISYGRPETWRFLFWATLLDGNTHGAGGTLTVAFDIQIGQGRSMVTLAKFARFQFTWAADVPSGTMKYATQVQAPDYVDGVTTPANLVQNISAQDIQCTGKAQFLDADTTKTVNVEVGAFFSPEIHIRPEWHAGQFPGRETAGK